MPCRTSRPVAPRARSFRAAGRLLAAVLTAALVLAPIAASAAPDPDLGRQWALATIGAQQAWQTSTGAGVLIGVVDSGVDLTHQDLAGRIAGSTNCLGAAGDPGRCTGDGQDDVGHGTHVAGIIAGDRDNGVGGAGVAPDSRLLVAKAIDAAGGGNIGDIEAGVHWVVDHGAKVVNLSLSEASPLLTSLLGSELRPAVEYAWSHGAVPVVAGGNQNLLGLLGSYGFGDMDALVVGATGPNDQVASFSSPLGNAKWALLAPGGLHDGDPAHDVFSTFWVDGQHNQYAYMAGTSMATPHVSGAVALLLAKGYSQQQAVERILATVDPVACGGGSPTCRGRLNVAKAVGSSPAPAAAAAPSTAGGEAGAQPPAAQRNQGSQGSQAPTTRKAAAKQAPSTAPAPAPPAVPAPQVAEPSPSPAPPSAPPPTASEPAPGPAAGAPPPAAVAGAQAAAAASQRGGAGLIVAIVLGIVVALAVLARGVLILRRREPGAISQ